MIKIHLTSDVNLNGKILLKVTVFAYKIKEITKSWICLSMDTCHLQGTLNKTWRIV